LITTQKIHQAVSSIHSTTNFKPRIALILGSGLGEFADNIRVTTSILASEIPNYPVSTVSGHKGRLVFGYLKKDIKSSVPVLIFEGRNHFYESGNLERTIFPVVVAHHLGIKKLIVTNAAGGLNSSFSAGDLMVITDILNLTFLHPFVNKKTDPRKPAFSVVNFDSTMQKRVMQCAALLNIPLQQGTYCWLKGPSYETPAEIQMLKRLGVDAVGMSTVPELHSAHLLGMKTVGISLISNLAAGISLNKLSHAEVTETANNVKERFSELMESLILSL
jgi:purine-nucleoside phosphorylase